MTRSTANPSRSRRLVRTALMLTLATASGAAAVAVATGNTDIFSTAATAEPAKAALNKELPWVAAAPGRVEPKSGQVRIGSGLLGRIAEVTVKVNDVVEEGEMLIRLDDEEAPVCRPPKRKPPLANGSAMPSRSTRHAKICARRKTPCSAPNAS
jgi:HlyD family secretion protein